MTDALDQIALRLLLHSRYYNLFEKGVSVLRSRERRGRHMISDAGYGSRVSAGNNFAMAQMARNGVFGVHGPGKRKRVEN